MILDIIIIAVVALLVILGVRRGIAKTLLNLISLFLSGFLGCIAAKYFSGLIYSSFIAPDIKQSVAQSFSQGQANIDGVIENMTGFTGWLLSLIGINGESLNASMAVAVASTSEAAANAVENTAAASVTSVLNVILLVIFFLVFLVIFKLISKRLVKIFKIPVLKQINKFLGGVLGLCEGLVLCYIGVIICTIIVPLDVEFFVTPELIAQSTVFNLLYNCELSAALSSSVASGKSLFTDVQSTLHQ